MAQPFVLERIHLLGDDVRSLADTAQEQLRVFKDRRADLFVMVFREQLAEQALEILPFFYLAWQKIIGPSRFGCKHKILASV